MRASKNLMVNLGQPIPFTCFPEYTRLTNITTRSAAIEFRIALKHRQTST